MNRIFAPNSQIQFVFQKSSRPIKVAAIAAVALSLLALLSIHAAIDGTDRRNQELRAQATALEKENLELQQDIGDLGSVQSIEKIAQEQLEMGYPGTILIEPQG